jgi:hypothetical protein
MTSLLSSISGRFSSSVVLGTFFPVTVFAVLFRVLVIAAMPNDLNPTWVAPLKALDERWEVLAILLVSIVATGLLHNLNTPLIRLYEGYPWQSTWFGTLLQRRQERLVKALQKQRSRVSLLLRLLQTYRPVADSPEAERLACQINTVQDALSRTSRRLFHDYPEPEFVLPTRLGNVIRSFESYSSRLYEMDAIAVWPRLQAVLKKEYAEMLGEAKAGFDFMLNSATLAALLAMAMLGVVLVYPDSAAVPQTLVVALVEVGITAVAARWLYLQAVDRARSWGSMVRGAFDLYRWELLAQLGYTEMPRTPEEERALWATISTRLMFGDFDWLALPRYAPEEPAPAAALSAQATPVVPLSLLRGAQRSNREGLLPVHLRVTNDSSDTTAKQVVVLEALPPGYDYAWESATTDRGSLLVTGADPLRLVVRGDLPPGQSVQLTYALSPRPSASATDATARVETRVLTRTIRFIMTRR